MAYQEISDDFWKKVEPLLEPFRRKKSGGSPPPDFRLILSGIFYVLKTGCQWHHLPPCHGSKSTVHAHFQDWVSAGAFAGVSRPNAGKYQEPHGVQWEWRAVGGALVPAPARGRPVCLEDEALGRDPTDRGRGGSKTHLPVDQNGIPPGVTLVGANTHDSRLGSSTLAADILPRPEPTPEHPRNMCLDKGYDYARVEQELAGHAYIPHIRRIGEEKVADGEKIHPARRWVVERTIAWMKGFRAIRTRYLCKAKNYLAMIHLACALILSRKLEAA
jgi:putative transposase